MGFCSHNEIDKFAYNDCVVTGVMKSEDGLIINLEALIVKANNSQNTNFTDSYAGDTVCRLTGFKLNKVSKIGFRYYDADDNLVEEVPDEVLSLDDDKLLELMKEMYLYKLESLEGDKLYHLEIETMEEDVSIPTDSYEIVFTADDIDISWDRYMNSVQN